MTELSTITSEYKKQFIEDILNGMTGFLDNKQLSELNKSLYHNTAKLDFADNPKNHDTNYQKTNQILIQEFIKAKKTKGLSKNTLRAYNYSLTALNNWAIKSYLEMTSEDLKEFFLFYESLNNCSKTTLNNMRRNLSSFFRFLTDEEKILINPMLRIPAIKEPKRIIKAFTYEEIEKLRWYFTDRAYKKDKTLNRLGIRNLAIFELLISSGIRISELIGLKKENMDFDECKAIVLGKGNKERIVYFSERAKTAILKYYTTRDDDVPYVFATRESKPTKIHSVTSIEQIIRNAGETLNIKAHPHKCRHYFCTQMIKKGMPIDQVQKLMGHESIETTLRYLDMDDETIEMTHRKYTNF